LRRSRPPAGPRKQHAAHNQDNQRDAFHKKIYLHSVLPLAYKMDLLKTIAYLKKSRGEFS